MENETLLSSRDPLTIQLPDPSLVLLVGPAGSGKSTFAARHFQPTEIVSSDHCRAMICDDESDQSINREAFGLLHHITRLRLAFRQMTVVDATNLQDQARRPLLRMARACQFPVFAIVFKISLETCLANNRNRPHRLVTEDVISQHTEELPGAMLQLKGEGYQRIFILDELNDELNIDTARVERIKIGAGKD
ncbi:MAG: AAA family ATPase [Acidobacteria bacterium]|nr:AAA family ATPase [Acidobacteriota bacterium]